MSSARPVPNAPSRLRNAIGLGVLSLLLIVVSSAMRGWPFSSLTAEPWIFQINGSNAGLKYSFLALFYIGAAGFCVSWVKLLRLSRSGDMTSRQVLGTYLLWSAILFFATPLFSGDVYVYFVDGELLQRGFDPYATGVSAMGPVPHVHLVHPLWRDTTTMYGPIFIRLAQGIAFVTQGNLIAGVMILRVLAIVSVLAAFFSLRALARRFGRPEADGLVFAILNPITMLHLVGGAHNDAAMLGLLSSGLAIGLCSTRWGWRVVALGLCAAAGAFKIPGFAGALVLGWIWAGGTAGWFRRSVWSGAAGFVALAWFEIQTLATGLGWGWTAASNVPGLAHPLLAPANAVALSFGGLVGQGYALNEVTRGAALLIAATASIWLVMRTCFTDEPYKVVRAFGWSLLMVAWAGPAVYPWYLGWGIAIIGAMGTNTMRKPLTIATCVVIFLVAPGGYGVLDIPAASWRVVMAFLTTSVMAWALRDALRRNNIHPSAALARLLSKAANRARRDRINAPEVVDARYQAGL